MVAIFTGTGAGLARGSASVLGGAGRLGSAGLGAGGERVSVNAATGNLVIARQDEFLAGVGLDASVGRTYNSREDTGDRDNGDHWQQTTTVRVFGLTGTVNTAGSTIDRLGADGSVIAYVWETRDSEAAYWATDGAGAYDKLAFASGSSTWTWTDGDTQVSETYEAAQAAGEYRLAARTDIDGGGLAFSYVSGSDRLDKVTTSTDVDSDDAGDEWIQYHYDGSDRIDWIETHYTDLGSGTATLTRTSYAYDTSNRLETVTTDLTPDDTGDSASYQTVYTYDGSSDRVASIAQSDGSLLTIEYDGQDRVHTLTQAVGGTASPRITTLTYYDGYTEVTAPDGSVTTLDYGAATPANLVDQDLTTWSTLGTTVTVSGTMDGKTAYLLQDADPNTSGQMRTVSMGVDADPGDIVSFVISLRAVAGSATTQQIGLWDNLGGTVDAQVEILSGPGSVSGGSTSTFKTVSGLSQSETTRILITRDFSQASASGQAKAWIYLDKPGGYRNGQELLVSDVIVQKGVYATTTPADAGRLAKITYAPADEQQGTTAQEVTFAYDADGNVTSVVDAAGGETTYVYDAHGNAVQVARETEAGVPASATVTERYYDAANRLIRETSTVADAGSSGTARWTRYAYDGEGHMTFAVDPDGRVTEYVYNAWGGLVQVLAYADAAYSDTNDPEGDDVLTDTGLSGWASTQTGAIEETGYAYDLRGALTQASAVGDGTTLSYTTYDQAGQLIAQHAGSQGAQSFVYDGLGRLIASSDPASGTVSVVFNEPGTSGSGTRTVVTTSAAGATTTATYNRAGDLVATLGGGDTYLTGGASYQYDDLGRVRIATDEEGHTSYTLYDDAGRMTGTVNADFELTEYVYDAADRVIGTVRYATALDAADQTALDDAATAAVANDVAVLPAIASLRPAAASGDLWSWSVYDDAGRVVQAIDGTGAVTAFAYDASDRLVSTVAYATQVEVSGYRSASGAPVDPVAVTADANADVVVRTFYDRAGNAIGRLDGEGYLTRSSYDAAGRVVETVAYATATDPAYRAGGTLAELTPAVGADRRSHYVYDGRGLLRFQVDDLHDANGVLQGRLTEYAYDDAGLRTATTAYATAIAEPQDYGYATIEAAAAAAADAANDRTGYAVYDAAGRLAFAIDALGEVTGYTYDGAGRVVKTVGYATVRPTTTPPGLSDMATWIAQYGDGADRIARSFYSNAGLLLYTVDAEGYVAGTIYDAEGKATASRVYHEAVIVGDTTTLVDLVGMLGNYTVTQQSVYDSQHRVATVTEGDVTAFGYLANGLRNQATAGSGTADASTTASTFDAAGRVLTRTAAAGAGEAATVETAYDAFGRQTTATDARGNDTLYTYDSRGLVLSALDAEGGLTTYTYNAFGEVVTMTDAKQNATNLGQPSATYTYDELGRVLTSTDALDNQASSEYDMFGDAVSATDANGGVSRYAYDRLGRVVLAKDAAGYYTETTYTAFGEIASVTRYDEADGSTAPAAPENLVDPHVTAWTMLGITASATTANGASGYLLSDDENATGQERTTTPAIDAGPGGTYSFVISLTAVDDGSATTQQIGLWSGIGGTVDVEIAKLSGPGTVDANNTTDWLKTVSGLSTTQATRFLITRTFDAGEPAGQIKGYVYVDKPGGYRTGQKLIVSDPIIQEGIYQEAGSGDPLEVPTGPGSTTSFAYDRNGRLVETTDAMGFHETYGYNAFGERTTTSAKSETGLAAGGDDNLTRYIYDDAGRLVARATRLDDTTTIGTAYAYDARGNRTTMVEALALTGTESAADIAAIVADRDTHQGNYLDETRTTRYAYDKLGRLTETRGEAREVWSQSDHLAAAGQIVPIERLYYDANGNVTRSEVVTQPPSGPEVVESRTVFYYDDLGRKTGEVDALGSFTRWSYDANGNVAGIEVYENPLPSVPADGGSEAEQPAPAGAYRETSFAYDALGRMTSSTVVLASGYRTGTWDGQTGVWTNDDTAALTTAYAYDARGNVVATTDPNGNVVHAYYDALDRKVAQVDGEGGLVTWAYDAEGNVVQEYRYANAVDAGAIDAATTVADLKAEAGTDATVDRVTSYTYDRNGNRLSETRAGVLVHDAANPGQNLAQAATVTYTYNGLGQVLTRTEATGDAIAYAYDDGGRLTTETRSGFTDYTGATVTPEVDYTYDGLGNLASTTAAGTTGAAARTTSYAYGEGGLLASMIDAEGHTHDYFYDAQGRQIVDRYTRTGADGTSHTEAALTRYDALGRVTEQTVGELVSGAWVPGDVATSEYDAFGDVVRSGINGGAVAAQDRQWQTENKYDLAGRLWATNAGDGVWKYFGYDKNGNQTVTVTSAGDNITGAYGIAQVLDDVDQNDVNATYTVYDARGLAIEVVEENRQLSATTVQTLHSYRGYNAFGEVASETDARGATTSYAYNTMGKLTRAQGPAVEMTDEHGATLWIRPAQDNYYDLSGRLVATRDANGTYATAANTQATAYAKAADTGNLTVLTLLAGTGYNGSQALVAEELHADGGTRTTKYDIHGNARVLLDELDRETDQTFDNLGRLTQIDRPAGLTEHYAYDEMGQRTQHWVEELNLALYGSGNKELTDYDKQGRVVATRAFGGDVTTTQYLWQAGIATAGLGTFGGWQQTTTMANGKSSIEKTDLYGRATYKKDLGNHVTTYAYDAAGRQVSSTMDGVDTTFTWYNTGLLATNANTLTGTATYAYDQTGNRTGEKLVNAGTTIKDQSATYDLAGRMIDWTALGTTTAPAASKTFKYDANGNVRYNHEEYYSLTATGGTGGLIQNDYWFAFDSMNRLVIDKGELVGGTITNRRIETDESGTLTTAQANEASYAITYNRAGERATVATKIHYQYYLIINENDPPVLKDHNETRTEVYDYDDAGRVIDIDDGAGETLYEYDALGHQTRQRSVESGNGNASHEVVTEYDARGLVTSSTTSSALSNGLNVTTVTNAYGSGTGYALGQVVSSTAETSLNGNDGNVPDTATKYTYAWYDGAVQASIEHDKDYTGSTSTGAITGSFQADYDTQFTRDALGRLTAADVNDGMAHDVTFVLDEAGQVIRRDETHPANAQNQTGSPHERWYRFGGAELGYTGNNGTDNLGVATAVNELLAKPPTQQGSFRLGNNSAPAYQDFTGSYTALNAHNAGSVAGSYTVRGGESLQSIAQGLWGDASLWYKIAEANGLSGGASLVAGQVLQLPAGLVRTTYNANTFKPYDPAAALGDLSPTTPKPQKHNDCGILGAILMAAIAVAVAIALPELVPALAPSAFGGGVGGFAISGAIAGAAGSTVSQAVGVATGIQDSFSWKAVGLAALGGAIGGGLKVSGLFDKIGLTGGDGLTGVLQAGARGAITSGLNQGIARATGLQDSFSWAGVAAAGVGAAAGTAFGQMVHADPSAANSIGNHARNLGVSTASLLANAATRSAIEGSSFGRNVTAALPDVIAQAVFDAVDIGVSIPKKQIEAQPVASGGGGGFGLGVGLGFGFGFGKSPLGANPAWGVQSSHFGADSVVDFFKGLVGKVKRTFDRNGDGEVNQDDLPEIIVRGLKAATSWINTPAVDATDRAVNTSVQTERRDTVAQQRYLKQQYEQRNRNEILYGPRSNYTFSTPWYQEYSIVNGTPQTFAMADGSMFAGSPQAVTKRAQSLAYMQSLGNAVAQGQVATYAASASYLFGTGVAVAELSGTATVALNAAGEGVIGATAGSVSRAGVGQEVNAGTILRDGAPGVVLGGLTAPFLVPRVPIRVGPYIDLVVELKGTGIQANHLNQNAAFGSIIPSDEGLAVGMRGNAFTEVGSPHYEFHSSLEEFWAPYRKGGEFFGQVPTSGEYGAAIERALVQSGYSPSQAGNIADQAATQRLNYGLMPTTPVPRVPGRLPQVGR